MRNNPYQAPQAPVDYELPLDTSAEEPRGLGGWLILVGFALVINVLKLAGGLLLVYVPIFLNGQWTALTTPGSETYHPLYKSVLSFEIVGNIAFTLFAIGLIYLFFTKSRRFPMAYVAFLVGSLAFVFADTSFADRIPDVAAQADSTNYREAARGVIGVLIWVPYMLISKRVKNTFVE